MPSYHALAGGRRRPCTKGHSKKRVRMAAGRILRRALVYVCRPHRLQRDLSTQGSRSILRACGYRSASVQGLPVAAGAAWRSPGSFRTKSACFWAIRLAMLGFLHDAGRHSKLSGYWQVYGDAQAALALFCQIQKCRCLCALPCKRNFFWQLTVAA